MLLDLGYAGGHDESNTAFVTAFWDRDRSEFRRASGALAWNSLAWCASEPDKIIVYRDTAKEDVHVTDLLPHR